MLNLVINGMTGLIAALAIASLYQSLRVFFPAWRHLSGEVARLEKGATLHGTLREVRPEDIQRLSCRTRPQPAEDEKAAITPVTLTRQPRQGVRSPLRHATA